MYPKEFINQVLIKEIGDIKTKHPYLAFNLICSSIEFLGKCLSNENWQDKDSEKYFLDGIDLFPDPYRVSVQTDDDSIDNLAEKIYKHLRCGMIHTLLPDSGIKLTEIENDPNAQISRDKHPAKQNGKYVFVIEYFYDDFVDACRKIIRARKDSDKFDEKILEIPEHAVDELRKHLDNIPHSTPASGSVNQDINFKDRLDKFRKHDEE